MRSSAVLMDAKALMQVLCSSRAQFSSAEGAEHPNSLASDRPNSLKHAAAVSMTCHAGPPTKLVRSSSSIGRVTTHAADPRGRAASTSARHSAGTSCSKTLHLHLKHQGPSTASVPRAAPAADTPAAASPGGMASTGAGAGAGAQAQSSKAGAGAQASGSASSSTRCALARAATARHTCNTLSAFPLCRTGPHSVGSPSTAARAALQRATVACARSRGESLSPWDRCASASRARVDATAASSSRSRTASDRVATALSSWSHRSASGRIKDAASAGRIDACSSRKTQLAAWQIAAASSVEGDLRKGPRLCKRCWSANAARAAGTFDSHPQRAFAAILEVASFAIN
mmetsp:Transcript_17177/g.50514  ORF Transcript_17177/g.50514 Transcript_17177/m.50514 type:complete len:344 (+) Transcript_17177:1549-2580(+)